MIEREATVMIEREARSGSTARSSQNPLGAKGAKGRLVRVAAQGFYEVHLEAPGQELHDAPARSRSTVIMADEPETGGAGHRGGAVAGEEPGENTMPRTLKVAVAGLGPAGQGIARLVLQTPGLKLVGGSDLAALHAGKDLGTVLGLPAQAPGQGRGRPRAVRCARPRPTWRSCARARP